MAGKVFCSATVKVDGTAIQDVFDYNSTLGADLMTVYADGRPYGTAGCTFNHTASITYSSYDVSQATTTTASPLIGSLTTTSGVVLTIEANSGSDVEHTLHPARCTSATVTGGHGRPAELQQSWDAIGTSGTPSPTVTWGVAS